MYARVRPASSVPARRRGRRPARGPRRDRTPPHEARRDAPRASSRGPPRSRRRRPLPREPSKLRSPFALPSHNLFVFAALGGHDALHVSPDAFERVIDLADPAPETGREVGRLIDAFGHEIADRELELAAPEFGAKRFDTPR